MNDNLQTNLASRQVEVMQARFALRVTAALSELQARMDSPDIGVRLRFAREQALAHVQLARQGKGITTGVEVATAGGGGSAVLLGGPGKTPWWLRLGALVPLVVLFAGLTLIDNRYTQSQIEAAVEVDAAILVDDLPPEAYRDPGFVEFLRTARS